MSSKGTTFKATAPNGTLVTRTSKTMSYRFAVLACNKRGWGAWGWSQSEAGAAKMAREAGKCYSPDNLAVVPATT